MVLLENLVNIDSGTGQAGARTVLEMVAREWSDAGFDVEHRATTHGQGLLLATHRTSEPAPLGILMLGHADTVFEEGTALRRPFRRADDGRLTGPGVADMKGGLVVMLGVARLLRRAAVLGRMNITVLINSDEETGSQESRADIERMAQSVDAALVFEPGRPGGPLVRARRGTLRYRLTVQGVAAHSGVNPEDGAIQDLNGSRPDVSVNVGLLTGGTAVNTVPAAASALIDVRISEQESADHIAGRLREIAARVEVPNTSAQIELLTGRPPLPASDDQETFIEAYLAAGGALGQEVSFVATGGGSDGNFTGAAGVPTIDGLGPVGGGYHSDGEFIDEATLRSRTALTAYALTTLTHPGEPETVR